MAQLPVLLDPTPSIARVMRLVVLLLGIPSLALILAPNMMITHVLHDIAIPLDLAWRVLHGQVPNRDFHEPVGPLYPWMEALGMWLGHGSGKSVIYAEMAAAVLILPALAWTAARRLDLWPAVIVVCMVLCLMISPRALDSDYSVYTHLADYNRLSWVAVCLLTLAVFVPLRIPTSRTAIIDTCVMASMLAILLLTKMPMAVFGACLLGIMPVFGHTYRFTGWAAGILGCIIAVVVCVLWGSLFGYIDDLSMAMRAAQVDYTGFRWGRLSGNVLLNISGLLLLVCTLGMCWSAPGRWRRVGVAVVLAVLSLMASVENFDNTAPTLFMGGVCIYEDARRRMRRAGLWTPGGPAADVGKTVAGYQMLTLTLATALAMPLWNSGRDWVSMMSAGISGVAHNGASMIVDTRSPYSHITTRWNAWDPAALRIPWLPEPPLTPDATIAPSWLNRADLAAVWENIYTALRPFATPTTRIWALGFSNPFVFALGAQDVVGDNAWWDVGRTYTSNPTTHPSFAKILCNSDLVVDYQSIRADDQRELRTLVEPLLPKDFLPVAKTPWVIIWKRRAPCSAGSM